MKNFFTTNMLQRLLLLLVISTWSVNINAYYDLKAENEDGVTIYYWISGDKVRVVSGNSTDPAYSGTVNIPSTVIYEGKEYVVNEILSGAFENSVSLTNVGIPNTILSIGTQAFQGCVSLTEVDIPNSVTSIGGFAFEGCTGLREIRLPQSLTLISMNLLQNCSSLQSIQIPSTVTNIEQGAFSGCNSLKSITIPASVKSIGMYAFNIKGLTSVTSEIKEPFPITDGGYGTFNSDTKKSATLYVPTGTKSAYEATIGWEFSNIVESEDVNSESRAYAVWCEENTTLYFFSSDETITVGNQYNGYTISNVWSGEDITDIAENDPKWIITADKATHAVFEESFSNVMPKSTYHWFWTFGKLEDISGLSNLNTSEVTNMRAMFSGCSKLKELDVTNFNTDNVTTMANMFAACSSLRQLDVSNFVTSSVMDMMGMFQKCGSIEAIDVSNFNTARVTDMGYMFRECSTLWNINLSSFDTDNVTSMLSMFYECSSLESIDVSSFNTANVTDMRWMFYGCSALKNLDLSHFNTDNVTAMRTMFGECGSLETLNIDNWNTAKVESMRSMFFECKSLKRLSLSHFNTESNTSMTYMFRGCTNLEEIDLSSFDTRNVVECDSVFDHCTNLKDVKFGYFDLSKTKGIRHMFCTCSSLQKVDLSTLKTENVEYMDALFNACNQLRTIYVGDGWSIKGLKSSVYMFNNCYNLIGGNGTTYDNKHIDASYARIDADGVPGYFTDVKTLGIGKLVSNVHEGNDSWFTLDGLRLDTPPTRSGLYIHKGKKIVIER